MKYNFFVIKTKIVVKHVLLIFKNVVILIKKCETYDFKTLFLEQGCNNSPPDNPLSGDY